MCVLVLVVLVLVLVLVLVAVFSLDYTKPSQLRVAGGDYLSLSHTIHHFISPLVNKYIHQFPSYQVIIVAL